MSIFVSMRDNFMSGWGEAEGKSNVYQVECETQAQADQIKSAAAARSEMSRIKAHPHQRTSDRNTLVTDKRFSELGPIWTGEVS